MPTEEKQCAESWAQLSGLVFSPVSHCSSLVQEQQSDAFKQMSLNILSAFLLVCGGSADLLQATSSQPEVEVIK